MTPLQNAVYEIKFQIPREILDLAFTIENYRDNYSSIDDRIMHSVLLPKVMKDCNLVSGMNIMVPISRCQVVANTPTFTIVKVPKELIGNKTIISALSLASNDLGSTSGYNGLMGAAQKMFNTTNLGILPHTANMEMVGDNLILIHESMINLFNVSILLEVEHNTNFTNLHKSNSIIFAKLCVYATKAYIYNKLVVMMNKGYIYNGHELGIVKDIIDDYRESLEMYEDYFKTKWIKTAFANDKKAMFNLINDMVGVVS